MSRQTDKERGDRGKLRGLISEFYSAEVLLQGGSDSSINKFIHHATDPEFLALARAEADRMRKVAKRDFVSKVALDFLDRAMSRL